MSFVSSLNNYSRQGSIRAQRCAYAGAVTREVEGTTYGLPRARVRECHRRAADVPPATRGSTPSSSFGWQGKADVHALPKSDRFRHPERIS
jgi:hypothetical protein